jgi:hypothetical protein
MTFQHSWASCSKCQGLHYAGFPDFKGACPAGGQHEQAGSFAYEVEFDVPERPNLQHGWASCPKCQGLHYAGFPDFKGVCPAGGQHEQTGSFAYAVPFGVPGGRDAQEGWASCPKCQGFFYGPFTGTCPAGGGHSRDGSWAYLAPCAAISNFTFDAGISAADRTRIIDRHRVAFERLGACGTLTAEEKAKVMSVYRDAISHGFDNDPEANASAPIGGRSIGINFSNFTPLSDNEASQTLLHEMTHCAGYSHDDRRDPPPGKPRDCSVHDCPGDNGPYYGTAPLRAEQCIAGVQSDRQSCSIGVDLRARIFKPFGGGDQLLVQR